jgi:hypothetical protein
VKKALGNNLDCQNFLDQCEVINDESEADIINMIQWIAAKGDLPTHLNLWVIVLFNMATRSPRSHVNSFMQWNYDQFLVTESAAQDEVRLQVS